MESVGGANDRKKRRLPTWMMGGVASNVTSQEKKDDSVGNIKPDEVGSKVSIPKVKTRSRKVVKKILREDEETCITDEFPAPETKTRSRKVVKKFLQEDEETSITEEVSAPKTKLRSRRIVNESLDEDDGVHEAEDVNVIKIKARPKRGQKGTLREDKEPNTDSSSVLVKCATVKRSRASNSEVDQSDMNNIGSYNLNRTAAPRKKKKGSVHNSISKEVPSSSTDNGRELLMEDLIIIAQEYVKAESLTGQQNQNVVASETEKQLSAAAPIDEPTSSFHKAQTKLTSASTEVKSYIPSSTTFSNISSTGDAAQDMLNLLLGPLLTKPVEETTTALNLDDMLLNRPVRYHSQNHNVEESATLVKKKTSLKDKVAMFLD